MLVIEIDGMYHNNEDALKKDKARQQKLESFGIKILRFSEAEIKSDMLNVMRCIEITVIELIKKDPSIKLPIDFPLNILNEN